MPAKRPAKPKQKYQILVNRQQTYQFEVEAESAEKACQKLQRQLQAVRYHADRGKRQAIILPME